MTRKQDKETKAAAVAIDESRLDEAQAGCAAIAFVGGWGSSLSRDPDRPILLGTVPNPGR